jgi:hypothetical protein
MGRQMATGRRILALGVFRPQIGDRAVDRGMEGVIAAARASFPAPVVEIVTIRSLTNFDNDFALLSDDFTQTHAGGKFRGIASGYFVQEALEGGHGITDIHYDLTGLDNVLLKTHAGSELRSLIAHIRAFHPRQVDIHFRTEDGVATIRRDSMEFEGAPMPGWLGERFKAEDADRQAT